MRLSSTFLHFLKIFSGLFSFFQFCLRAGILSLPPRAFWIPKPALRAYNLTNARHVIFCAYIVLQHPFPPVFYKTEDNDRQILRPSSPRLLRSRVRGQKVRPQSGRTVCFRFIDENYLVMVTVRVSAFQPTSQPKASEMARTGTRVRFSTI